MNKATIPVAKAEDLAAALESLLVRDYRGHSAACCLREVSADGEWLFARDEKGRVYVTAESCVCADYVKKARAALDAWKEDT